MWFRSSSLRRGSDAVVAAFPQLCDDLVQGDGHGALDVDPVVLGMVEQMVTPLRYELRASS
jgi:hypothetical protein